ncbi:unnamed protein product [Prunus armeniaca]
MKEGHKVGVVPNNLVQRHNEYDGYDKQQRRSGVVGWENQIGGEGGRWGWLQMGGKVVVGVMVMVLVVGFSSEEGVGGGG